MRVTGQLIAFGLCLVLGLTATANNATAAAITLTALVSDRGVDLFPRDGTFESVFNNPSVVQITTPPLGSAMSEERTAIEFSLAGLLPGITINSVSLQLSPQASNTNLGLGPAEAGEVHGYAGNGVIHVADLMMFNLVASLVGPTPDGPVSVAIAPSFVQALIDANSPWAGFMFKGVDGPSAVLFSFAGTFSGIPQVQRPQLAIDFTEPTVIPEPGSLLLVSTGLAGIIFRARRRRALGRLTRQAESV